MFGMLIAIREDTTFNTLSSRIHILHRLHTVALVWQVGKRLGRSQCVKTVTMGSDMHGHQGRHCANAGVSIAQARGGRCTITMLGAAQSQGSALHNHMAYQQSEGL